MVACSCSIALNITPAHNRDWPPGVSRQNAGIERNPWNLTRLKPAEGARRSRRGSRLALAARRAARGTVMIDFATAFPNSTKVFDERGARLTPDGEEVTLRVPAREVALAEGNAPVRLYDTSGPQGHDV